MSDEDSNGTEATTQSNSKGATRVLLDDAGTVLASLGSASFVAGLLLNKKIVPNLDYGVKSANYEIHKGFADYFGGGLSKDSGEKTGLASDKIQKILRSLNTEYIPSGSVLDQRYELIHEHSPITYGKEQIKSYLGSVLGANDVDKMTELNQDGKLNYFAKSELPKLLDDIEKSRDVKTNEIPEEQLERLMDTFKRVSSEIEEVEGKSIIDVGNKNTVGHIKSDKVTDAPKKIDPLPTIKDFFDLKKNSGIVSNKFTGSWFDSVKAPDGETMLPSRRSSFLSGGRKLMIVGVVSVIAGLTITLSTDLALISGENATTKLLEGGNIINNGAKEIHKLVEERVAIEEKNLLELLQINLDKLMGIFCHRLRHIR